MDQETREAIIGLTKVSISLLQTVSALSAVASDWQNQEKISEYADSIKRVTSNLQDVIAVLEPK